MDDAELRKLIRDEASGIAKAILQTLPSPDSGERNRRQADNRPLTRVIEHPWTKLAIPIVLALVVGMGSFIAKGITATQEKTVETLSRVVTTQAVTLNRLDRVEDDVKKIDVRVNAVERRADTGGTFR